MIGSGNTIEPPAGPRVRIYELAKELALGHREMVAKVRSLGIEVANHMSHLDPADVERVRRAVTRERKESTTEERINDTVIRRRSKSVAPGTTPATRPAAVAAAPAPATRTVPPPVARREPAVDDGEAASPPRDVTRPMRRTPPLAVAPGPVAAKPAAPPVAPATPAVEEKDAQEAREPADEPAPRST